MVSMFTRKAPYHYGWDWGPRFVTSGIWRPASLEAWDAARLEDVQVFQRSLDDAQARLEIVAVVNAARAGRGAGHGERCRTAPRWPRASARCSAGAMSSGWRR